MINWHLVIFWVLQVIGWHMLIIKQPLLAIFFFTITCVFGFWAIMNSFKVK